MIPRTNTKSMSMTCNLGSYCLHQYATKSKNIHASIFTNTRHSLYIESRHNQVLRKTQRGGFPLLYPSTRCCLARQTLGVRTLRPVFRTSKLFCRYAAGLKLCGQFCQPRGRGVDECDLDAMVISRHNRQTDDQQHDAEAGFCPFACGEHFVTNAHERFAG